MHMLVHVHTARILRASHTQPMLLDIFTAYAKADTSLGQVRSGGLATINFQELLLLARDGQLIDERLTIISITTVRARARACLCG